VQASDE